MAETLTLMLAGDLMTGRGIDQAMVSPSEPTLYEPLVRDARDYLRLAERRSGAIPRPVDPSYLWGDALEAMRRVAPRFRIVNLETAVTTSATPWPAKGIHYRMHPAHVGCLSAGGVDCCVLANNHVLDWGRAGLAETLRTLQAAGLRSAGAGADAEAAWAPAVLPLDAGRRLLVFACATASSGVDPDWAAARGRSGVALLDELSDAGAGRLASSIARHRRPGDRVLVSIHWGDNWVRAVPSEHRRFAHRLIDLGAADLVHGHSSHHPLPVEVHRDRLILYGCGDLLNDYESLPPHGDLRGDLGCLYFATLDAAQGTLRRLEVVPHRIRRFRLEAADAQARAEVERLIGGPLLRSAAPRAARSALPRPGS